MNKKSGPDFDFYTEWLGIGPLDQAPTYYQLLGLPPFEADPTRIAAAAEQQRGRLAPYCTGAQAGPCGRLLAEIDAACRCLLSPAARQDYDKQLRRASVLLPEAQAAFRGRIRAQQVGRLGIAAGMPFTMAPATSLVGIGMDEDLSRSWDRLLQPTATPHHGRERFRKPVFFCSLVGGIALLLTWALLAPPSLSAPSEPSATGRKTTEPESTPKTPNRLPDEEPADAPVVAPQTVMVLIASEPRGAEIAIDGLPVGKSTPAMVPLSPGEHEVRLAMTGYNAVTDRITVQAETPDQSFDGFQLAARDVKVLIDSQPPGAMVRMGDDLFTPTPTSLMLPPGRHTVELTMDGFHTASHAFDVPVGTEPLTLAPVTLEAIATPPVNGPTVAGGPAPELPAVPAGVPATWALPESLAGPQRREYMGLVQALLSDDWSADAWQAYHSGALHFEAARQVNNDDPKLPYVYGLLLTHHRRMADAVAPLVDAVALQAKWHDAHAAPVHRSDFAPWRQLIRTRVSLGAHEQAAADCLDLIRRSAASIRPDLAPADFAEATAALAENAAFTGTIFGFFQGPAETQTRSVLSLPPLEAALEESLAPHSQWETYQQTRQQVLDQYASLQTEQYEIEQKRLEQEVHLRSSGELRKTTTRSSKNGAVGNHYGADYSRLPYPGNPWGVAAGYGGWYGRYFVPRYYTYSLPIDRTVPVYGPHTRHQTWQSKMDFGHSESEKVEYEKLPRPYSQRAAMLSTYLPTGLEVQRRDLLSLLSYSGM